MKKRNPEFLDPPMRESEKGCQLIRRVGFDGGGSRSQGE